MLQLYYAPGACSIAAHIILEESGEAYETQRISIEKGENKTAEYLKLNPFGRVPTLVLDDGTPLTENVAIIPYLGKRFDLWPADPSQEAKALSVVGFLASNLHPTLAHVGRPERYTDMSSCQENVRAIGRKSLLNQLGILNGMYDGKQWLANDYSVLDAYVFFFVAWIARHNVPSEGLNNIRALTKRMLERPGVQAVLTKEQLELS